MFEIVTGIVNGKLVFFKVATREYMDSQYAKVPYVKNAVDNGF